MPNDKLTSADFEAAAKKLGAPVAAVRAVAEVESNGAGFLPDGRPKILFERHWFAKLLAKEGRDEAALAKTHPDICNTVTGGYQGGAAEWERFAQASAISPQCAICATSWGAFQIMGFHWQKLGFNTALEFKAAMMSGEAAHLKAFTAFIAADPALYRPLRSQDWAAFAKAYNGPDYAKNRYDEKMAAAFKRFSRAS